MSDQYISNLDFAQKKQTLSGEFLLSEMPRLKASLVDEADSRRVTFELSGHADDSGLPALSLRINAKLPITCQRCFEAIEQSFELDFDYVISEDEPEGAAEADDIDWLEPEIEMSILSLVEDELLLAIPFAAMHPESCGAAKYESGERVSPFAVLKDKFK